MPYSHHSHSGQFCKHASGSLEDVVLEALHQGFEVYGLSEHVPRYRIEHLYPEEKEMSLGSVAQQFDDFIDEAHRLKTAYASQITLLVGLETEVITNTDLEQLKVLLRRHGRRIEYLVGSIHHVNGIPIDFDQPTFERSLSSVGGQVEQSSEKQMENFLSVYLDAQLDLMRCAYPEIIGHLDLCRLYNPNLRFSTYPLAWKKLERNILFAIEYGALFEFNAAAFRKKWDSAYPGEDVVELIIKNKGRFALSDDSHGPHAVGLNYDRLARYLLRMGIAELWALRHSDVLNAAGRSMSVVKIDGNWWEHPFWAGKLAGL